MLWLLIQTAAAAAPPAGAWFRYTVAQDVHGTDGEYVGYGDRTRSRGRYEVTAASEAELAVHARYDWTFASDDGKSEAGAEDRPVTVALPSRRYSSRIDLDDEPLAKKAPADLAPWFWIDPSTAEGAAVRILDMDCAREPLRADVPGRPGVEAIRVECTGDDQRDDDYGKFRFSFHDTYWFDPVTGLVLAERYTENDRGTFEGRAASFALQEALDVQEASYAAPVAAPAPLDLSIGPGEAGAAAAGGAAALLLPVCAGSALVLALGAMLGWMGLVLYRGSKPPARVLGRDGEAALGLLTDPLALAALEPACTTHFGAFLEDFARKALAAGDPVAFATAGGRLVGLAWNDREASIATVLAPETPIAEGLARWIDGVDFFSEQRHLDAGGRPRFNVHETYVVLALDPVAELAYDAALVTRMADADRAAVDVLCGSVFEVKAERWLRAHLEHGDLPFVAKVDGNVVGFALATVCGEVGRLHTLAVDPAFRDRGIGGELVRARLTALARLGATRALVEIASWNVASLHLARQAGFRDVGELFVETTRAARAKRTIVRR